LSPTDKHFLTLGELASRWQTKEQWIYNNHARLRIPNLRLGRGLRFPLRELEEWEREHLRNGEGLNQRI